ncbi:MAG: hypothetical protein M3P48_08620 [Actinomycetota bacterium]|nr:hypothetical protein [Actinomycetota bacterium]
MSLQLPPAGDLSVHLLIYDYDYDEDVDEVRVRRDVPLGVRSPQRFTTARLLTPGADHVPLSLDQHGDGVWRTTVPELATYAVVHLS